MACRHLAVLLGLLLMMQPVQAAEQQALFGDLHVHTRYSTDAYTFGTRTDPDEAYRYAKGEPIRHAAGFEMKLSQPLDFYAVTDHAEYLGMLSEMADSTSALSKVAGAQQFSAPQSLDEARFAAADLTAFQQQHFNKAVTRSTWARTVEAANRHYQPGKFTTFAGYEYTSSPGGQNMHRNVIFRSGNVPEMPFSRLDDENPERLWAWMDGLRARGIDVLAIPHNSNGSNGRTFELTTFAGGAMDRTYAETRMRNEPVVEITQAKGTSDTHPFLSPNDEWADFEIYPYWVGRWNKSKPRGSYVREAYLNGLAMEEARGVNAFRFGLVGASDTHNAGSSVEETSFISVRGNFDATPQRRGSVPVATPDGVPAFIERFYQYWSASGLTGLWAAENTREAIFDALRRKETFATSGPRIRVRFFGGFRYSDDLLARPDLVDAAYADGVPMGGDLARSGSAKPSFLVWAQADAHSGKLQRLQVVKGWAQDGTAHERVYDVACSDGLTVDAATHRCPDNGATVDVANCSYDTRLGAAELKTLWRDPDFDSRQRAVYYVRVLENPTCRWSTWDAVRAGTRPRRDIAATIQERAWSSPIWYAP